LHLKEIKIKKMAGKESASKDIAGIKGSFRY